MVIQTSGATVLSTEKPPEFSRPIATAGSVATARLALCLLLCRVRQARGAHAARAPFYFRAVWGIFSRVHLDRTVADNRKEPVMEPTAAGAEKPFWVILSPLEHFISGHDTAAAAEAEAKRLNEEARAQGRPPHYIATPRRWRED